MNNKLLRTVEPSSADEMLRTKRSGKNTLCQLLRDIYSLTSNKDIQIRLRIAMSMAKSMNRKLEKYKEAAA